MHCVKCPSIAAVAEIVMGRDVMGRDFIKTIIIKSTTVSRHSCWNYVFMHMWIQLILMWQSCVIVKLADTDIQAYSSIEGNWVTNEVDVKLRHGPLTRYVILGVAHATQMPGTFPHYRQFSISTSTMARAWRTFHDACRDHWLAVWSPRWGKRYGHSRRMRNPHLYVSDKRPFRQ